MFHNVKLSLSKAVDCHSEEQSDEESLGFRKILHYVQDDSKTANIGCFIFVIKFG